MEQAHIHTKYKLLHESALLLKHFMIRYVITCLTDGHYTPQHQQKKTGGWCSLKKYNGGEKTKLKYPRVLEENK